MTTHSRAFLVGGVVVLAPMLLASALLAQNRPSRKPPAKKQAAPKPRAPKAPKPPATQQRASVAVVPQLASGSSWPVVQVESSTSPIIATGFTKEAAPQDRFDTEVPIPTGVAGKLAYAYHVAGQAFNFTFRDINVSLSHTKQPAPVITLYAATNQHLSRQDGFVDFHLLPDGQALEFATYYNDFVRSYYPYRWDFKTGVIRLSAAVPALLAVNPALILNEAVVWNADRSHLAYVTPLEGWNLNTKPTSLAFASRTGRAAFIEPRTEEAFLAWTRDNTLLFDLLAPSIIEGMDIRRSFKYLGPELAKLAPQQWPSIYAAPARLLETSAAKKTRKVQAKPFLANAFAPIPSPDGRFVAFSGWAPNDAVAEPKPGEEAVKAGTPQWWLWDSQSKTRTLIGQTPIMPENAVWSPDSRTLYFSTASDKVTVQAVGVADLLAGAPADAAAATRAVGEFALQDAAAQNDEPAQLPMRGFSRDRKYLFIGAREFQPRPDTKPREFDHSDTLRALRLSDGQHQIVARLKNVESYDWLDLSTPAP